jgi:FixJ family two-component response regulator
MTSNEATVYVVDDDPSIRTSLARLLRSVNLRAETFSSAREFLERQPSDDPACMVLDIKMPGQTGLELQQELAAAGFDLPIIFLTGHGNVPVSVTAMKGGALDFLEKPVDDRDLLDAIERAIDRSIRTRAERSERSTIRRRVDRLTPRERQVFGLVVDGLLNKQVAGKLHMSEKTVKVHRARVMQKMEADSLAELVRLAERAGITPAG